MLCVACFQNCGVSVTRKYRERAEPNLVMADITGAKVVDKLIGQGRIGPDATAARDARVIFDATIVQLGSVDPLTAGLVARLARCGALEAFWWAVAEQDGLATEAGVAAAERASEYSARAERLTKSILDTAMRVSERAPLGADPHGALLEAVRS